MNLRPATMADTDLLYGWAIDSAVREASFNTGLITLADHRVWMKYRLSYGGFYIAEVEGRPVGYARVEPNGELSVSVDAPERGRGLGRQLIAAAAGRAVGELGLSEVWARVKTENEASMVAFAAAGFVADGEGRFVWQP